MFFRMVKKDLKESKGLNVILFLFMVIVSSLAAISGFLLYVDFRGTKLTEERVKPHDYVCAYIEKNREVELREYEEAVKQKYPDAIFGHIEGIRLEITNMSYKGMEEDYDKLRNSLSTVVLFLSTQTFDMDLMYTEDNKPFYVENGNIAITGRYAALTGLKVGDKLRLTTQMGNIYELNISHIVRDPSMDNIYRFIVSEPDYEVLSKESPAKNWLFTVQKNAANDEAEEKIGALINNHKPLKEYPHYMGQSNGVTKSNTMLVSVLVSFFLLLACIFMLIVVFFAISFTIKAAVKKEERELGIMKALGTDSLSFRWLLAAKYIAFAAVGSVMGCLIGLFVGGKLVDRFFFNISYTFGAGDYLVAVFSAILVTLFIILYIMHSMKRIDKISVMDVLHGEARADSIRRGGSLQLNRSRKISIPLFLALKDILGGFKKYILLFVAYTAGCIVVLMSIMMRDTIISSDFLYKYYPFKQMDFVINLTEKTTEELSLGTGRIDVALRQFDSLMEKEGIPAAIEMVNNQDTALIFGDEEEDALMFYNFDPEGLRIRAGSRYPVLEKEVLIDQYTAESRGLAIGDKITMRYEKLSEDRLSSHKAEEEFVITGFVDRMTNINGKQVVMAKAFKDAAVGGGYNTIGFTLDAPEKEKDAYRERIKELFPDDYMTDKEFVLSFLGLYDTMFSFMRNAFVVVVACILGFLTVMYQTIFMKDEEAELALLIGTGIDDKSTKGWHFLRMMIIFGAACILAVILTPTLVSYLSGVLFKQLIGLTGWELNGGFVPAVAWMAFITMVIATVMSLVVKKIESIEIWRIRNE
ncbi:MAG: ABC transporter permease [Lachnospiraceae bacterium]|nr:ABC transporter permease [Lachnospiraceae bacterium]